MVATPGSFMVAFRAGVASVPAFAPIGASAARYADHCWGDSPLPEVVAHHAEHWPHISANKQFAPQLTLSRLDAPALAQLAHTLGAAAVTIELDETLPQLQWAADRLSDAVHETGRTWARGGVAEWFDGHTVFVRHLPAVAPPRPWVLHRALGLSFGWNAAETDRDHLDAAGLLGLLTAVLARGGRLVLDIGLRSDGTLPPAHAAVLEEAAAWLLAHADAIHTTEPFDVPGDAELRYLARPGADDTREVVVIYLRSEPSRELGHLSPHRYPVVDVAGAARWQQRAEGLLVEPGPATHPDLPHVYRITVAERRLVRLAVQGHRVPGRVTIGDTPYATIHGALAAAVEGDVVDVAPGRHTVDDEPYPLVVPAGVTLRGTPTEGGLGSADPSLPAVDEGTVLDVAGADPATPAVVLGGDRAALEGLTIERRLVSGRRGRGAAPTAVLGRAVHQTRVEQCRVEGNVTLDGCHDASILWNVIANGGIALSACERATITGNKLRGDHAGAGIGLTGGADHRVDANHVAGFIAAVALQQARRTTVSANDAHGDRCAVVVGRGEANQVVGNRLRGMRGVVVSGGEANLVSTNVADHTDTGVLLDGDARATEVAGNRFEGCRVGILAWSHSGTAAGANRFDDCRDHDVVDPQLGSDPQSDRR